MNWRNLIEITGMDNATFQPPAGASGELTGLLTIKKYLEENNLTDKTDIIVPILLMALTRLQQR